MPEIILGNGARITTFPRPSSSFDPLTASPAELGDHGFPPLRGDPRMLQQYRRVWGRIKDKFQYVVPVFDVAPRLPPRPRRPSFAPGSPYSWSGYVLSPPAKQSFCGVSANWVIPNVYPLNPPGYHCGCWIGLDGYLVNTTLCQAGIGYYVYKQGSSIIRQFYPFVEWYPDGYDTPPLANVPIRPGDSVTMLLYGGSPQAPSGAGSTTASVVLINNTSGLMTTAMFSAPGPPITPTQVKLLGTSAEWIVEAPYNFPGATLNTLPDYGQVFFSSCEAYMIKVPQSGQPYNVAVDAGTNSQGFTGTALNMVFGPNKDLPNQVVISESQLVSSTIIQCSWSGQNLPENLR